MNVWTHKNISWLIEFLSQPRQQGKDRKISNSCLCWVNDRFVENYANIEKSGRKVLSSDREDFHRANFFRFFHVNIRISCQKSCRLPASLATDSVCTFINFRLFARILFLSDGRSDWSPSIFRQLGNVERANPRDRKGLFGASQTDIRLLRQCRRFAG